MLNSLSYSKAIITNTCTGYFVEDLNINQTYKSREQAHDRESEYSIICEFTSDGLYSLDCMHPLTNSLEAHCHPCMQWATHFIQVIHQGHLNSGETHKCVFTRCGLCGKQNSQDVNCQ